MANIAASDGIRRVRYPKPSESVYLYLANSTAKIRGGTQMNRGRPHDREAADPGNAELGLRSI